MKSLRATREMVIAHHRNSANLSHAHRVSNFAMIVSTEPMKRTSQQLQVSARESRCLSPAARMARLRARVQRDDILEVKSESQNNRLDARGFEERVQPAGQFGPVVMGYAGI